MVKFYTRGLMTCLSLIALISCQDHDAGFSEADVKKGLYAKNFEKTFGTPDPNQDWSMAATLTANVNLKSGVNGQLLVFTTAPTVSGSQMLALGEVVDGKASVQFNAVKGENMLYARVINSQGQILEGGYYDVIDNTINLGKTSTRGETTDPCSYALDVPVSWTVKRMCADAIDDLVSHDYVSYTQTSHDFSGWTGAWSASNGKESTLVPNVFDLTNYIDYSQHDNGFTVEELRPIFSSYVNKEGTTVNGVFKEGVDHIAQYVKTGILEKDATLEVAERGEVTIDVMWRGTDYYDRFGYYYYTGNEPTAEELWALPKYMILGPDLITTKSTLTQGKVATDIVAYPAPSYTATITGFEYKDDWYNMVGGAGGCANLVDYGHPKSLLRGTKIRLAYFGEDGKSSADFNFPAGVKIGFFMYSTATNPTISDTDEKFFFSNADLTYQLAYRTYAKGTTAEEQDNRYNRPFAVTFNYDGRTFLGFADECGDCDLNDLVLYADNVKPKKDITPDDLVEPESNEWLFACEDLGGSFDYDFNDIVWSVSQQYNKTTHYKSDGTIDHYSYDYGNISVKLYAAGGTLPSELLYEDSSLGEVHQAFGQSPSSLYSTVNATSFQQQAVTLKKIEATTNIDINTFKNNFKISVEGQNGVKNYITAYDKDGVTKTPQTIVLPSGWDWPTEGTCISDVYPTFVEWAQDVTKASWVKSATGSFITNPYGATNSSGGNNNPPTPPTPPSDPEKAASDLILGATTASVELDAIGTGKSTTVSYTTSSTGDVNVSSSNPNVTVSANDGVITITTDQVVSDVTITVSQDEDETYNASGNKTIAFSSSYTDSRTELTVGETIALSSSSSDSGLGANHYAVSMSNYKLPSTFSGTATVMVTFGGTVNLGKLYKLPATEYGDWIADGSADGESQTFTIANDKLNAMISAGGFMVCYNNYYGSADPSVKTVSILLNE